MSDYYDNEAQEIERLEREYESLVNEYNRLVNQYNNEVRRQEVLERDRAGCINDTQAADSLVARARSVSVPRVKKEGDELVVHGGLAHSANSALTEIVPYYLSLKNQSTAVKNMTQLTERYYFEFGSYNKLRAISLGYIVGVDSEMWNTDAPRKIVEKAYLNNVNYWLASATMAVMLWANDEKEACERAVKRALMLNEKKSALFFMLVNLRFNRMDAAKEWYYLYFSKLNEYNISDELQYILQAILCGALGRDIEFEKECLDKIYDMYKKAESGYGFEKRMRGFVKERLLGGIAHSTSKDYLMMQRCMEEYEEMKALLSAAETNKAYVDYYKNVMSVEPKNNVPLSKRIEDVLVSLISAYDDDELKLKNEIRYNEFVVQAKGDTEKANKIFREEKEQNSRHRDIGEFIVSIALDKSQNVSLIVRKFALTFIMDLCSSEAAEYAKEYRKKEKQKYKISFDGFTTQASEDDFEQEKVKLANYYKGVARKAVKKDKTYGMGRLVAFIAAIIFVVFTIVTICTFNGLEAAQKAYFIILIVVLAAVVGGGIVVMEYQRKKILLMYERIKADGEAYLKTVLDEMRVWREDYKKADADNDKFVAIFRKQQ